jgi:hypothetical protein
MAVDEAKNYFETIGVDWKVNNCAPNKTALPI